MGVLPRPRAAGASSGVAGAAASSTAGNATGTPQAVALAAYYLLNPGGFELTPMDVRIETKGVITRGMSVADKRTWGEKNINTQVVTKLDRDKLIQDFLEIYNRN